MLEQFAEAARKHLREPSSSHRREHRWALAAVMMIGVAIGSFYFIERFREEEL